jgi:hypothetical protein
MDEFNSVVDRALSEHKGSCLMNKKQNGKYSLFMPVTNLGEIGATPEQIEKTVIGNMAKTYISGRKDNPQQALTIYLHRDNLKLAEQYKGTTQEFLRVFPDFSAIKYSGEVDYKINDTQLNSAEQGELSITIKSEPTVVDDCFSIIEDTAIFTSELPEVVKLTGTGSTIVNVTTNPADATITAVSATTGVATATYENGQITITGVASGSSVVTVTASKTNYASWSRTILVVVK